MKHPIAALCAVCLIYGSSLSALPIQSFVQAPKAMIGCLAVDSGGALLASCENLPFEGKSYLKVYDIASRQVRVSTVWKEMLHGSAFLQGDSRIVLCAGLDLVIIDAKTGKLLGRMTTDYAQIMAFAFDGKNGLVYVGGILRGHDETGAVSQFEVSSGLKHRATLQISEPVFQMAVKGQYAAVIGESALFLASFADRSVREWRYPAESAPKPTSSSFLADGDDVLSAGFEGGGAAFVEYPSLKLRLRVGGPSPHSVFDRTRFLLRMPGSPNNVFLSDRGEFLPPSGTRYDRSCLRVMNSDTQKEVDHVDFEGTMESMVVSPAGPVFLGFSNGMIRRVW